MTDSRAPGRDLPRLTVLQRLEAEAIHIIREVAACFERPVILFSVGKDSAVMLHLIRKAFAPAPLPFPLLHVDTTWKFPEMYAHRDGIAAAPDIDLIIETNESARARGANPMTWSSVEYTHAMKTQTLLASLRKHRFDAAFGGARRDEEASRAKERIFSFRDQRGSWDPRDQRPELWDLYNTKLHPGESIRVFPLSNWTEVDVWLYILQEDIRICDLYFARPRRVVRRDGQLMPYYDQQDHPNYSVPMQLRDGERIEEVRVRYRTLGCWPLTAATESSATTVEEIVAETLVARQSERSTRVIDHDQVSSMETKKREGYF